MSRRRPNHGRGITSLDRRDPVDPDALVRLPADPFADRLLARVGELHAAQLAELENWEEWS